MDKKHESYEETHRKLVEAMQNACIQDDFADYKSPDIDLSFIYEDAADNGKKEPARTRKSRISRFNKVAAIIVVILLGGNILMMATQSGESYGEKGLLHRISETVTGVVTDEDNPVDSMEIREKHLIESEEMVASLSDAIPNLYYPSYLPTGFIFKELYIEIYNSDYLWAKYEYVRNDEKISIGLTYLDDSQEKVYLAKQAVEIIKCEDRYIYIYMDSSNNAYVTDIYLEDCTIDVNGLKDKNEAIALAMNLKYINDIK